MYIPGRLRTASSPLRTWMLPASYVLLFLDMCARERIDETYPNNDRKQSPGMTLKHNPASARIQLSEHTVNNYSITA